MAESVKPTILDEVEIQSNIQNKRKEMWYKHTNRSLGDDFFKSLFTYIDEILCDLKHYIRFHQDLNYKYYYFSIRDVKINIANVKRDHFNLELTDAICFKLHEYVKQAIPIIDSINIDFSVLNFLDKDFHCFYIKRWFNHKRNRKFDINGVIKVYKNITK